MDLHGACACGRNVYVIELPDSRNAHIFFDNSRSSRRHFASPFTAWLQVPFSSFHSSTFAFFPDESHRSIRRTFVSPFEPTLRRHFCGYCGTQLSQWTEDQADDTIYITLGSLYEEDIETLEENGVLNIHDSSDEDEGHGEESRGDDLNQLQISGKSAEALLGLRHRGAPWFESIVENTVLGRVKRQRGGYTGLEGTFEWEVIEWTEDDEEGDVTPSKRKIAEVEEPEDQEMRT